MDISTSLHMVPEVKTEPDMMNIETNTFPHNNISKESPNTLKDEENIMELQELMAKNDEQDALDKSLLVGLSSVVLPGCSQQLPNQTETLIKIEQVEAIDEDEKVGAANLEYCNIENEEVDIKEEDLEANKTSSRNPARQKHNLKGDQLRQEQAVNGNMFTCEQCDYQTIHKGFLKRHFVRHHNPEEVNMMKSNQCDLQTDLHGINRNSVKSLIAEPFYSRSSADKFEVKILGRPTPTLNIVQSVSSKKRTFNRTFNPAIYDKHTWICGCEEKNALFCFPCLLFGGETWWTKIGLTDLNHSGDRIRKHTLSAKHMKNVLQLSLFESVNIAAQLNSAYRRNIEVHNEQVRHNRYILNNIINCVRYCGIFELAVRGGDDSVSSANHEVFRGLIDFSAELDIALKQHLEKASVFKDTSKTIQNEILQAMFSVCQEEISREIKEADYVSIIVDDTSDVSNTVQMAIVFRYIVKGKLVERFWDFLIPSRHDAKSVASGIVAQLDKHLKDNNSKLIAQTYDGAAVMKGSSNGVQATVKKTYKHAAYVHCYAHQLNLVMLNAVSANNNVRIFFANIQGICTFFSNSPQRIALLNDVVKKRSPRSAPTRWNFNSRVVGTIFDYRQVIIGVMQKILNENRKVSTTNQASGYIQILTNNSFVSWLNLFYKIMPHVDLLSAKFQTRGIDAFIANNSIIIFETELIIIRNGITEHTGTDDSKPSTSKRPKTNECGEFVREAKEVCDIIICQAKERFSFTGHLVAASLFYSENYCLYRGCFPVKKYEDTIQIYPFFDGHKLRTELIVIYETEEFESPLGLFQLYDFIFQNCELSETFSETLKLLKILLTIPMPSAEVERCFSTLKQLKTFLKNTVDQEKLSALAMLSKERSLIESVSDFNQRVIDKFAAAKDRRKDFLFK